MTALVAAGVVSHSYVLTTRGRRTGRTRRNPVIVVELDARVGWSRGRGRVVGPQCARQRAGKREPSRPDEELHHPGASPAQAAPVLKRASATRRYFQADRNDR